MQQLDSMDNIFYANIDDDNEIILLIYIYVDELNNTIQLTSVWC